MADKPSVEFHPEALAELERAKQWYERQRHGLGQSFFQEITALLEFRKLRVSGRSFDKKRDASWCIVSHSQSSTANVPTVCSSLL